VGVSLIKELTSIFSPIETLIVSGFGLADACGFVIMFPDQQSASGLGAGTIRGQINVVLPLPSKTLPFLPF